MFCFFLYLSLVIFHLSASRFMKLGSDFNIEMLVLFLKWNEMVIQDNLAGESPFRFTGFLLHEDTREWKLIWFVSRLLVTALLSWFISLYLLVFAQVDLGSYRTYERNEEYSSLQSYDFLSLFHWRNPPPPHCKGDWKWDGSEAFRNLSF